jgi:DNA-damage-inducible protein J
MSYTVIHTPIDLEIDTQAKLILLKLGLSMNEAIKLFLTQLIETKQMPFAIHLPNKETIVAIEEARKGQVERYPSLEAMWTDLHSD